MNLNGKPILTHFYLQGGGGHATDRTSPGQCTKTSVGLMRPKLTKPNLARAGDVWSLVPLRLPCSFVLSDNLPGLLNLNLTFPHHMPKPNL